MAQRRRVQAGDPTRIPHQPLGSGSPALSLTSITIRGPLGGGNTHTAGSRVSRRPRFPRKL